MFVDTCLVAVQVLVPRDRQEFDSAIDFLRIDQWLQMRLDYIGANLAEIVDLNEKEIM